MTSMNWITEVFGAHIMEYESKYRREIFSNAQCRVGNRSKVGRSCDLKCRSSDAINKHVIIDETL
jgi:hypothetical protein